MTDSLTLIDAHSPLHGNMKHWQTESPLAGAFGLEASAIGDAISFQIEPGSLSETQFLTSRMILSGDQWTVFTLKLYETPEPAANPQEEQAFVFVFALLNECEAQVVIPLEACNQNRWNWPRQAGMLKPMCWGSIVDPAKVCRGELQVERIGTKPARWWMTPLQVVATEPAPLAQPTLPRGRLIDEFGQSTLRDWPAKTQSRDEIVQRLKGQLDDAPRQIWPNNFSKWGGWCEKNFQGTGYFRLQQETGGNYPRWWLVDPDGYAFWSAGVDCINPGNGGPTTGLETIFEKLPDPQGEMKAARGFDQLRQQESANFPVAHLVHTFGSAWLPKWQLLTIGLLKRFGFNTIGNWSHQALGPGYKFPHVLPLKAGDFQTPKVFRDMPDVFDPQFENDAKAFAQQLEAIKDDPALIGYFLMNEPKWGFAIQSPAEGMLINTPECFSRSALVDWLHERYGDEASLQAKWGEQASFDHIRQGRWKDQLTKAARTDLETFSTKMIDRYFRVLGDACREVDPHHLNLGVRYYTVPPDWVLAGMGSFDVFSMNSYTEKVEAERLAKVYETLQMPIMIGEWHFGALDVGLPASGIGHVTTQTERGKAYRVYLEDAAAKPWCVGVHYFQWMDQSPWGRFDGEAYNIGFMDGCHRPYIELATAARTSHTRLYDVATGRSKPYDEPVAYLPRLF